MGQQVTQPPVAPEETPPAGISTDELIGVMQGGEAPVAGEGLTTEQTLQQVGDTQPTLVTRPVESRGLLGESVRGVGRTLADMTASLASLPEVFSDFILNAMANDTANSTFSPFLAPDLAARNNAMRNRPIEERLEEARESPAGRAVNTLNGQVAWAEATWGALRDAESLVPAEDIAESYLDLWEDGNHKTLIKKTVAEAVGMSPSFGVAAAAYFFTGGAPLAAGAAGGSLEAISEYRSRKLEGAGSSEALGAAGVMGVGAGILNAAPFARVATKFMPGNAAGRITAVAADMLTEGATESLEGGLSPLYDLLADPPDDREGFTHALKELAIAVKEEALVVGPPAALTGGGISLASSLRQKQLGRRAGALDDTLVVLDDLAEQAAAVPAPPISEPPAAGDPTRATTENQVDALDAGTVLNFEGSNYRVSIDGIRRILKNGDLAKNITASEKLVGAHIVGTTRSTPSEVTPRVEPTAVQTEVPASTEGEAAPTRTPLTLSKNHIIQQADTEELFTDESRPRVRVRFENPEVTTEEVQKLYENQGLAVTVEELTPPVEEGTEGPARSFSEFNILVTETQSDLVKAENVLGGKRFAEDANAEILVPAESDLKNEAAEPKVFRQNVLKVERKEIADEKSDLPPALSSLPKRMHESSGISETERLRSLTANGQLRQAAGNTTQVIVSGQAALDSQYALLELNQISPSHSFRSGTPQATAEYPAGLQPRGYAPGGPESKAVIERAQARKGSFWVENTESGLGGPPIVATDGTVLGGNGRTMTLHVASSNEDMGWYARAAKGALAGFGLSNEEFDAMHEPVIVRVVDVDPDSQDAKRLAVALNKDDKNVQSTAAMASSLNMLITGELLDTLSVDPEKTFSSELNTPSGGTFREVLKNALGTREVERFFQADTGLLNEAGMSLAKEIMLTKLLGVETVERLSGARARLLTSVEGAAPALLRIHSEFPQADITPQLQEALTFIARHPGLSLSTAALNTMKSPGIMSEIQDMGTSTRSTLFLISRADQPLSRGKINQIVGTGWSDRKLDGILNDLVQDGFVRRTAKLGNFVVTSKGKINPADIAFLTSMQELDTISNQGDLYATTDEMTPETRMLAEFFILRGNKPRQFREGITALLGVMNDASGLFAGEINDSISARVAEALGVKEQADAAFGQQEPRSAPTDTISRGNAAREAQLAAVESQSPSRRLPDKPAMAPSPVLPPGLKARTDQSVNFESDLDAALHAGLADWVAENTGMTPDEISAASRGVRRIVSAKQLKAEMKNPEISDPLHVKEGLPETGVGVNTLEEAESLRDRQLALDEANLLRFFPDPQEREKVRRLLRSDSDSAATQLNELGETRPELDEFLFQGEDLEELNRAISAAAIVDAASEEDAASELARQIRRLEPRKGADLETRVVFTQLKRRFDNGSLDAASVIEKAKARVRRAFGDDFDEIFADTFRSLERTVAPREERIQIPQQIDPSDPQTPLFGDADGFFDPMALPLAVWKSTGKSYRTAKLLAHRYFMQGGDIPRRAWTRIVERNNNIQREMLRLSNLVQDFHTAASEVYGSRFTNTSGTLGKLVRGVESRAIAQPNWSPLQAQQVQAALNGGDINTLPEPLRGPTRRMRNQIDHYTNRLIAVGAIAGDLAVQVSQNRGTYLRRTYKIFRDPRWAEKIRKDPDWAAIKNKFESWVRAEYGAGVNVEAKLTDFMERGGQLSSALDLVKPGGVIGSRDMSILKALKDIPEPVRMLWGEDHNAMVSFAATATSMINLIENHKFLTDMRTIGVTGLLPGASTTSPNHALALNLLSDETAAPFMWEEGDPNQPSDTVAIIDPNSKRQKANDALAPLEGVRTTPEIKRALELTFHSQDFHPVVKYLFLANTSLKWAKTVGAQMVHIRNFTGNIGFIIANGHHWKFSTAIPDFFESMGIELDGMLARDRQSMGLLEAETIDPNTGAIKTDPQTGRPIDPRSLRAIYEELQGLGVIGESVGFNEYKKMVEDMGSLAAQMAEKFKGSKSAALFGLYRGLNRLYASEDNAWKIFAYIREYRRYSNALAGRGFTNLEIKQRAADIVRNTTPTYSLVPEAIRGLRQNPAIGSFVSFPWEVMRVSGNQLRIIRQELSDPDTRGIGFERLFGLGVAYTAGASLAAMSRFMLGIDNDDEEARREFYAPWEKHSNVIALPAGANNELRYIDTAFTDPYSHTINVFNAVVRNQRDDKSVATTLAAAFWSASSPFLKPEIGLSKFNEIANNKREGGGSVYNPQDSYANIGLRVGRHFMQAWEPGTVTSARRVLEGIDKHVPERQADVEAYAAFTGIRVRSVAIPQAMGFKVRDFNDDKVNANRLLTTQIFEETATAQDILKGYEQASASRYQIFKSMHRITQAARTLGFTEDQVFEMLTERGLALSDADAVLEGFVPQLIPSEANFDRLSDLKPEALQAIERRIDEAPAIEYLP